ncbi:MAG: DUF2330 domain-containing protein [Bacteroidia bacterium]|nr:DUF2330 domain-containing protein [Bacteroidia bacterium]
MKNILAILLVLFGFQHSQAFCGFYVAKASLDLFNHASQVILVKDGNKMTVTMYSDFHGDIKDFAMVVPVPEVLQKEQIKVIEKDIFTRLNDYTGPRLVKYHDPNFYCPLPNAENEITIVGESIREHRQLSMAVTSLDEVVVAGKRKKYKVKVQKKYTIGGYDILILSAKKSKGLEEWLKDHDYQIPKGASEVLEPYIKSGMKFFVVKVNEKAFEKQRNKYLHPLQITYNSERFMLPIRLGMANAKGDQDMIVYAFSKKGRIECTNYQTHEIPSNMDVPLAVAGLFDNFYSSLFDKSWAEKGKDGVMFEYGWNITGSNPVKCDPCPTPALTYPQLVDAGVDWLNSRNNFNYSGKLYISRMHVRYNRETFPQDLTFQETPNWENFQGRYVLRYPGKSTTGLYNCDAAQTYLKSLRKRRIEEVKSLESLTDWPAIGYQDYIEEYDHHIIDWGYLEPLPEKEDKGEFILPVLPNWFKWVPYILLGLFVMVLIGLSLRKREKLKPQIS